MPSGRAGLSGLPVGAGRGPQADAGGTAGGGEAACRCRSVYPTGYTGHVLKGEVLEGGVLGVGVEVGVGVHLVEFGAFFLHGLADQTEDQARRISFPG